MEQLSPQGSQFTGTIRSYKSYIRDSKRYLIKRGFYFSEEDILEVASVFMIADSTISGKGSLYGWRKRCADYHMRRKFHASQRHMSNREPYSELLNLTYKSDRVDEILEPLDDIEEEIVRYIAIHELSSGKVSRIMNIPRRMVSSIYQSSLEKLRNAD